MFGEMFAGVSAEQLNKTNHAHMVNYLALALVLFEKGIISPDEIEKAKPLATHIVDQELSRQREEQEKEFNEKYPGMRKLFSRVFMADASK